MDAPADSLHAVSHGHRRQASRTLPAIRVAAAMTLALLFGLCLPSEVLSQAVDSYEGLEVSWQLADDDCSPRVLQHERSFEHAHTGQASELIRIHAGAGTYVHVVTATRDSRVIDELSFSVWVKANRPGLQLSARAVLPRSTDPRNGEALTTLIRGTRYADVGKWEKLTVQRPAEQLSQQVPILRSQFGSDVSAREAHVDMLVLNAYGGEGITELWLDDLEVTGQVVTERSRGEARGGGGSAEKTGVAEFEAEDQAPRLQGGVLAIEGRPQLVRAIDYNGEPFAWLKSLGFNAVRLDTPPTVEQFRAAEQCGIWLIVPPPANQAPREYGTALKRVLAWDLGSQLADEQLDATRRQARQLRSVPPEFRRAMICTPRRDAWAYSRIADMVVLKPPGPNNSLPLASFGQWYLERARMLSMGAHFWASIPTQISPRIATQISLMGSSSPQPLSLEPDQLRLLVYHAIASGARGLLFRSYSRLDSSGWLTDIRAKTLQRLNQELALVEPWAATGTHENELETNGSFARASVLKTDRSRCLLVVRGAADQQYVAGPVDTQPVSFDVPGVPQTDEVYRVDGNGLQRITPQRGTGVHIALEKPELTTIIVLTQDRLVIDYLAKQAAALRESQGQGDGEIATQMYAAVVDTHQQLLEQVATPHLSDTLVQNETLDQARNELQHFQRLTEAGGHERACDFLRRGRRQLARARYQNWKHAARFFPCPVASPLCVTFFSLPWHYGFGQRLKDASWGPNVLTGGDFEDLSLIRSSGWKNLATEHPDLETRVELSLHSPRSGRSALRLQCWPAAGKRSPLLVEAPPLRIISAPIDVQAGQIVYVHGWARVEQPIMGSMDGLLIYDSVTQLDLAQRIHESKDWREFAMYRVVPRNGAFTLTMALSGVGEAWLDDVTVHLLGTAASP